MNFYLAMESTAVSWDQRYQRLEKLLLKTAQAKQLRCITLYGNSAQIFQQTSHQLIRMQWRSN